MEIQRLKDYIDSRIDEAIEKKFAELLKTPKIEEVPTASAATTDTASESSEESATPLITAASLAEEDSYWFTSRNGVTRKVSF